MSSGIELAEDSDNELQRLQKLLSSMDDKQLGIKSDEIIATMGGIRKVLMNHIATQPTHIEPLFTILSQETNPPHRMAIPVPMEDTDSPIAGHPSHDEAPNTLAPPPLEAKSTVDRAITLNVKRQQNKFVVYLNEQNDTWHWLLPADKQDLADRLVEITLHSKWAFAALTVVFILSFVCRFMIPTLQFVPALLCVIYGIASLLTFNVAMTRRMLKSFIFWFKMYNWFVAIICYIMIFNASVKLEGMNWIAGTMIIGGISLHDGWRLNKILKIMMCFMVWFIALAIYVFVYLEGDPEVFGGTEYEFKDKIITLLGRNISTKSNCLNALFNILIFMGGQLAKMVRRKDKTSVLAVRPKVIWVKNWAEMNNKLVNSANSHHTIIDLQQDA